MAKEKDASAKTQRSDAPAENQDWLSEGESESEGHPQDESGDYVWGPGSNSSSASARTQQSDAPEENEDWLNESENPGRRKDA